MAQLPANPPVVASALAVHAAVTAWAWRDIGRRDAHELRGSRTLWRVLTALNAGNSLLYLLVGRRGGSTSG